MNWKHHMLVTFGLSIGSMLILHQPPSIQTVLWISIATASSLLPDLDTDKSKANQIINPIVFIAGLAIGYYITSSFLHMLVAAIITFVIYRASINTLSVRHRGPFHSIFFPIIIAIPVYLYSGAALASSVAFGIICHMLEDKIYDITGFGGGNK